MKTKSLAAIAIALTLGMASTSCSKNNDEPSVHAEAIFNNEIAINTELADLLNIEFTYTDLQGKTTTTNITECPKEKRTYKVELGDASKTYEAMCYVYKQYDATKQRPAQTKFSMNVTSKGVSSGKIPVFILPNFIVGIPKGSVQGWQAVQEKTNGYMSEGIDFDTTEKVDKMAKYLTTNYGIEILSISTTDTPMISKD